MNRFALFDLIADINSNSFHVTLPFRYILHAYEIVFFYQWFKRMAFGFDENCLCSVLSNRKEDACMVCEIRKMLHSNENDSSFFRLSKNIISSHFSRFRSSIPKSFWSSMNNYCAKHFIVHYKNCIRKQAK